MKCHKPNGFTLLELLLAVSLLTLITASITGGVHLGQRSWEASRASEALDEVESAVRATTGLLAKSFLIAPDEAGQSPQGRTSAFVGAAEGCRFVMLSEGGAQWGGLSVSEIGVENSPTGKALVVWTKPYRPLEGLGVNRDAMKRTVVAEGLMEVRFAYYGSREQARATWDESWRDASNTPALVSVKIVLRRMGRDLAAMATVALRQR